MYRVLIIDDEKFIRKSIRNRIDWEAFGITEIEEAGNGEEALALMDSFRPQIVLVDIRMPRMDGLAFITEAKKKHPGTDYVIMSAYSDFSYAKTAISLGVEAYLLKPVNKKELEELLRKILHRIHEKKLSGMNRSIRVDEADQNMIFQYPYVMAIGFYSAKEDVGGKIAVELQSSLLLHQNCCVYFLRNCSRSTCYVFLINAVEENRETMRTGCSGYNGGAGNEGGCVGGFCIQEVSGSGGAEHLLPEKKDVFSGKQNDYSFAVRKQRIYRTEKQNPGGAGTGLQTDPERGIQPCKGDDSGVHRFADTGNQPGSADRRGNQ